MRYPGVEILCAALFAWVAYAFPTGPSLAAAVWMFFAAALLTLTLIDLDTFLLPDSITQPLLWLGLIWHGFGPALGSGHGSNTTMEITLNQAVLGAVLGYAVLGGFAYAFRLLTGKEGMGQGDFKLLAALGAWLGAESLFTIVLFAAVFGVAFGPMVQWLRGNALMAPFPFGPCLVAGGMAWLMGLNLYVLLGNWVMHGL